jgi:hypothetical protein
MSVLTVPPAPRFILAGIVTADDVETFKVHRVELLRLNACADDYSPQRRKDHFLDAQVKHARLASEESFEVLKKAAEARHQTKPEMLQMAYRWKQVRVACRQMAWRYYWESAVPFIEGLLKRAAQALESEIVAQKAREGEWAAAMLPWHEWAAYYGCLIVVAPLPSAKMQALHAAFFAQLARIAQNRGLPNLSEDAPINIERPLSSIGVDWLSLAALPPKPPDAPARVPHGNRLFPGGTI